jgi:N6-adenosine-specific RNA methylase IME4
MIETMRIDAIQIGPRARKDMGDIDSLARSIADVGLLHPVVVRPDGLLIAGQRRLAACRKLGLVDVAVTVVDLDNPRAGERAENVERKDFTPSEDVAIWKALENRAGERTDLRQNLTEVAPEPRKQAEQITGLSTDTLSKARTVVESGNAELIGRMDETGNVNRAWRELRRAAVAQRLQEIASLPVGATDGLYDVVVIDPPWPMQKIERDVAPEQVGFDYPTMALDEIAGLPIPHAVDCHLWLWTTHKHLPSAFEILETWGAKYVCCFVWHKNGGFQPFYLPQYNCEFALYARWGAPQFCDLTDFPTCFTAPRTGHSEKPDAFYEMVRRVTDGRRIDMFARKAREGFETWGNEAPE